MNSQNFITNPKQISESKQLVEHIFFHKQEQKKHIRNVSDEEKLKTTRNDSWHQVERLK